MKSLKHRINFIVAELARKKIKTRDDFLMLLKKLVRKYRVEPPAYSQILEVYKKLRKNKKIKANKFFEEKLKKRPIRSLSGVAVVSVLTKPYPCPGHCLYCPTDKNFPKSYLAGEPAADRAKGLKYDPYTQVKYRLETLQKIGHTTDKIELIVIGGSFTAYPDKYKKWFIKRCFQAANADKRGRHAEQRGKFLRQSASSLRQSALVNAQRRNERAKNRIISLSVETRPDLITLEEIKKMRELGITKIELGIQTLDEKVLAKNLRGHGVKEVATATKMLKDAGFKICYHIMPGLYGSTPKKDLLMFKKLFIDQNFQPDYLKIYPCVVVKGSQLYNLWKNVRHNYLPKLSYRRIRPWRKKYKPYSDKTLINLLIKMKKAVPPYVRIIRVFRDIPSNKIEAGSKISNLREVVQKEMAKRKLKCQCIRCREIKDLRLQVKDLRLTRREYQASDGKEIFLSFEDIKNDKLLAFLRLRLPRNYSTIRANSRVVKNEIYQYFPFLKNAAIIRELHTYGEIVEIGKKKKNASQHKNLGKKLVKEAERVAKKTGYKKIAVIAGIGSRQYWRKLGYKLEETYMVKNI